ncbi:MAG: transglutaminase family protein [Hyphomicrobiaceae bacterium]|nr:transglutaminase family protein [Hyphomicrobiaceae bacterium]
MRITVRHRITIAFEPPATGVVATLRLSPRDHTGQYVCRWQIDLDDTARLVASQDAFGNLIHGYSRDGAMDSLTVIAHGEVEVEDTVGVLRGTVEKLPLAIYLRETHACQASDGDRAQAEALVDKAKTNRLDALHELMTITHEAQEPHEEDLEISAQTQSLAFGTKPDELFRACRFVAAARHLRIPARFVSGYRLLPDEAEGRFHIWAEAFVPDYGWIAFDPELGACPNDRHIRVAIGLDPLAVAPHRFAPRGFCASEVDEMVTVLPAD